MCIAEFKRRKDQDGLIDGSKIAHINANDWSNTEENKINKINAERQDLRKLSPQTGGHFLGAYIDLDLWALIMNMRWVLFRPILIVFFSNI